VYGPQDFHMCAARMVNTSVLRSCFLTNTSNNSVFSQQSSQQDSHEALIKLMHYLPEAKTLSVVRTRYLRPTSHVYDELEADETKLSQVSEHNTIMACQPEWDLQIELTDVKDEDRLKVDELLDRISYRVLDRNMRYEVKCIDMLGCVRNYHVLADTYEWNNKEPPLACTLFLQRHERGTLASRLFPPPPFHPTTIVCGLEIMMSPYDTGGVGQKRKRTNSRVRLFAFFPPPSN
jgi:hypothetical protein